jgi:hypothetical protein
MSLDRGYVPRIQILATHFRLYKTSQELYYICHMSIESHLISPHRWQESLHLHFTSTSTPFATSNTLIVKHNTL